MSKDTFSEEELSEDARGLLGPLEKLAILYVEEFVAMLEPKLCGYCRHYVSEFKREREKSIIEKEVGH